MAKQTGKARTGPAARKARKQKPAPQKPAQRHRDRPDFWSSLRLWRKLPSVVVLWVGVLAVAAAALAYRLPDLGADPDIYMSWSQDLFTDPPQYMSYARNAVLFGDWDPFDDNRLALFQNNVIGYLGFVVLTVFGASVAGSNLTATILSLLAILFVALGCGRSFGRGAGWMTAAVLSCSYMFVQYGRVPFLENGANCFLALAFFCAVSSSRGVRWALLSGVAAAIAAFFGKITSTAAVPAFLAAICVTAWTRDGLTARRRWMETLALPVGFAAVALGWLVTVYGPNAEGIGWYVETQRLIQGSPMATQSLGHLVRFWFTFGLGYNGLFVINSVMALPALIGMALFTLRAADGAGWRDRLRQIPPAGLVALLWFWAFYASLFPFGYRPVRYQTVLLLPLAVFFGYLFSHWWSQRPERGGPGSSDASGTEASETAGGSGGGAAAKSAQISWWAVVPLVGICSLIVFDYVLSVVSDLNADSAQLTGGVSALLVGVVLAVGLVVLGNHKTLRAIVVPIRPVVPVAAVILLGWWWGTQHPMFTQWRTEQQHSLSYAGTDLTQILSPDAVLTGSYAPAMTQANELRIQPHMFGVKNPDTAFFARFPVTHIAVTQSTDHPVIRDYPDIMDSAALVGVYPIRNLPIAIYRVAEVGGNTEAMSYEPSDFERAVWFFEEKMVDSANFYLRRFALAHPDNYNLHALKARLLLARGELKRGREEIVQAKRAFPDDFALYYMQAQAELGLYKTTNVRDHLGLARREVTEALRLNPRHRQSLDLAAELSQIR